MSHEHFPFDLLSLAAFDLDDPTLATFRDLAAISMTPPFPWGQHTYTRLLNERLPAVPGDLIECGVGEGGMSICLARIAQAHKRRLFCLDSFQGLPTPDAEHDNAYFRRGDYQGRRNAPSLFDRFRRQIAAARLEKTAITRKGWFARTLPRCGNDALAFVHIDADLYSSVRACLDALYPRISAGGLVVIDDFFHHAQGPQRAVAAYFSGAAQMPLLNIVFPYSVAIIKGEAPPAGLHRAIDGHRYSFALMRHNRAFRDALLRSRTRASNAGALTAARNADRLLSLLAEEADHSSQIYDYWRALADWWDCFDAPAPLSRAPLGI